MKIKDYEKIAEVMKTLKEKKIEPDILAIDDYSDEVRLILKFFKEEK